MTGKRDSIDEEEPIKAEHENLKAHLSFGPRQSIEIQDLRRLLPLECLEDYCTVEVDGLLGMDTVRDEHFQPWEVY